MQTWSEADSRELLISAGISLVSATQVPVAALDGAGAEQLHEAARGGSGPWVLKVSSPNVAHKTERGLVRLGLRDCDQILAAAFELANLLTPEDGECDLLLSPMLDTARELIVGATRDASYGPVLMLGVGGIAAELIGDAVFRQAPISEIDAGEMIEEIQLGGLFDEFRGRPPIDRGALAKFLARLGDLIIARTDIQSIDCNPVLIDGDRPVGVDALVVAR
ncbi:MAG: acetate--CoA ligase family protein [Acidimicrobiia bacterium]|nr:acetate--CoA ligase family protein [Acidimicrobiia bacterium]MBP8180429.1 acetate--CoA ligase family protein [Acidimicrobiia bacterium]